MLQGWLLACAIPALPVKCPVTGRIRPGERRVTGSSSVSGALESRSRAEELSSLPARPDRKFYGPMPVDATGPLSSPGPWVASEDRAGGDGRPDAVLSNEGVGQDDELAHHGDEGHLARLAALSQPPVHLGQVFPAGRTRGLYRSRRARARFASDEGPALKSPTREERPARPDWGGLAAEGTQLGHLGQHRWRWWPRSPGWRWDLLAGPLSAAISVCNLRSMARRSLEHVDLDLVLLFEQGFAELSAAVERGRALAHQRVPGRLQIRGLSFRAGVAFWTAPGSGAAPAWRPVGPVSERLRRRSWRGSRSPRRSAAPARGSPSPAAASLWTALPRGPGGRGWWPRTRRTRPEFRSNRSAPGSRPGLVELGGWGSGFAVAPGAPPAPGLAAGSCSCGRGFAFRFLQLHLADYSLAVRLAAVRSSHAVRVAHERPGRAYLNTSGGFLAADSGGGGAGSPPSTHPPHTLKFVY